ncbi:MAG: hypothetical protein K5829_10415 [Treponema sp.]|nr:hypothetical protein [Treponema sp.]
MSDSENKKTKKKKPFIVRFLLTILIILLVIILSISAWFIFCAFQKEDVVNAVPENYSAYVRTDSLWDALEPLMDLKAADIVLADPSMSNVREPFYKIRESELRNNKLVDFALSRRLDAILYDNKSALAIIDMGFLSGITRLAPVAFNFINVENLSYVQSGKLSHFEYKLDGLTIYFKAHKNLVIVSTNHDLFDQSISFSNAESYTLKEAELFKERLKEPFRITADGKKLLAMIDPENQNPYIPLVSQALSEEDYSTVTFGISDEEINLSVNIPMSIPQENKTPIMKLLSRDSAIPEMLPKLTESVQYYTFLKAGTLEELKDSAFSVLEKQKNIKKIWNEAENLSNTFLNCSLNELLFSWTGNEYAVLGLEGKPDPVFVIKVGNEEKRQEVFDKVLSSMILKSDTSLLLDGIRMPRIEFPSFIRSLLEAFNINLSLPYYMIKEGFIYFSQSPENLASMNAAIKNGVKLTKNELWKSVSTKQTAESSMSLYYNLDRSIPFFIKGKGLIQQILQLYNIGRMDLLTKDNNLKIVLQSVACQNTFTQKIPGFPIEFEANSIPVLHKSNNEKSKLIFWQQGTNTIKAFNSATLKVSEKQIENLGWIIAASEESVKANGGEVWAITKDGIVNLLNSNLENVPNFPIFTGNKISCKPSLYEKEVIIVDDNSILQFISQDGKCSTVNLELEDQIKSEPTVFKKTIAIYEKGFLGGIHIFKEKDPDTDLIIQVDGIGYGSPCVFENEHKINIAFVSQSGLLSLWDETGNLLPGFPVFLDNLFYQNVQALNDNLIALAADGTLYKVGLNGEITKLSIPYLTAQNAYIFVTDYDNDKKKELFICGESNTLYGFNSELEFLNGFPVSGYGIPAFVDLNGDKKAECLTLSIDNKLNAWKVR